MTSLSHFQNAYFNRASKFGQNILIVVFLSPENPKNINFGKILRILFYGKMIHF